MRAPHGLNILDNCLTSPAKSEPLFGNLSLQARMKSSRWRSIPKWQSVRELKGNKVAYEVYYELLIEEGKSSDGLIAQRLDTLKNRRELAKIGFSEGVGYVPPCRDWMGRVSDGA